MSEGEQKKVKVAEEEEVDLISNLPDALLGSIIYLLPYMEVVRTSVLSKRWETLWKNAHDLNFDQRQMLKSLIEDYIQNSPLVDRLTMAMERKVAPRNEEYFDVISEAAMMITSNIDNHIGPLKSCTIRHLPESCASADVVGWLRKLLEKGVIRVSIERESCDYRNGGISDIDVKLAASTIDLPFEVFSNFKVLELKNYRFNTTPSPDSQQTLKTLTLNKVHIISNTFHDILSYCSSLENLTVENCDFLRDELEIVSPSKYIKIANVNELRILVSAFNVEVIEIDSVICSHEDLVFEAPKLQVLRAYNEFQMLGEIVFIDERKLLTTRDIIQICGGILGHRGSGMGNIFKHLVTLCLDFELNSSRNTIALSFALKSCPQLMNLQINNQVKVDYYDQNDNDSLPYPISLFWLKRDPCRCVSRNLKFVCIKGYKGGEFEFEFVKYLVLNGGVMDNITIWFLDECSWDEVVATACLRSYPKFSPKLSIDLKPGTEYIQKNGGSFDEWVRTLN